MIKATNMYVTTQYGNVAMQRICPGAPQFSCQTICPNAVQPNKQSNRRSKTLISGQASIDRSLGCPSTAGGEVSGVHSLDCHDVLCMVKETCTQQLHSTERTERRSTSCAGQSQNADKSQRGITKSQTSGGQKPTVQLACNTSINIYGFQRPDR